MYLLFIIINTCKLGGTILYLHRYLNIYLYLIDSNVQIAHISSGVVNLKIIKVNNVLMTCADVFYSCR